MNKEIFKDLFVDEEEMYYDILSRILKPFVQLGKKTADVYFTEQGEELTNNDKIVVYLLAKKVLSILGKIEGDGGLSPSEIANNTRINRNTIGVQLKRLKDKGLILKEKKKYYIPNSALKIIEKQLVNK